MTSERPIAIELKVQPSNPALLDGLEALVRLGLLSDDQARRIGAEYLICQMDAQPVTGPEVEVGDRVPEPVPMPTLRPPAAAGKTAAHPRDRLESNAEILKRAIPVADETAASSSQTPPDRPARQRPANALTQGLQALMAEFSVLWLLLLGVFMVVVSSAVLAATQWQQVTPTGQYGILWGYTLAFWGAGIWSSRQPNLQLTARMVQITTVLLIPVNFWMMDALLLSPSNASRRVGACHRIANGCRGPHLDRWASAIAKG